MKNLEDDLNGSVSLEDEGVYLLFGGINPESCEGAVKWVIEQNIAKKKDLLTLVISSEGGDVTAGFALIDVMLGSKIPIRTVGLGMIASMGLLIFLAGKKGERILTPNTLVLSHQWSGVNFGKEHELVASQKANTIVSDMIKRYYKRRTGLTAKKVEQCLLPASDVYLSAAESKELGICQIVKEFN